MSERKTLSSKDRKQLAKQRKSAAKQAQKFHREQEKKAKKSSATAKKSTQARLRRLSIQEKPLNLKISAVKKSICVKARRE